MATPPDDVEAAGRNKGFHCRIWVPQANGFRQSIRVNNSDRLCLQYQLRNHDFCALDFEFRRQFEHYCCPPGYHYIADDHDHVAPAVPGFPSSGSARAIHGVSSRSIAVHGGGGARDLSVYYGVVGGVFGLGVAIMCAVGVLICLNRWGRRARGASRW